MDIWAVQMTEGGDWEICKRVGPEAYGKLAVGIAESYDKIWSRVSDTAWVGIEGREHQKVLVQSDLQRWKIVLCDNYSRDGQVEYLLAEHFANENAAKATARAVNETQLFLPSLYACVKTQEYRLSRGMADLV